MFEVIGSSATFEVMSLEEAMHVAKTLNEFVTIKSTDMEIVGKFGVDSIKEGVCPDGVEYTWKKRR
jgi:hypothetical protein